MITFIKLYQAKKLKNKNILQLLKIFVLCCLEDFTNFIEDVIMIFKNMRIK